MGITGGLVFESSRPLLEAFASFPYNKPSSCGFTHAVWCRSTGSGDRKRSFCNAGIRVWNSDSNYSGFHKMEQCRLRPCRAIDVSLRAITRSIGWGLFQVT